MQAPKQIAKPASGLRPPTVTAAAASASSETTSKPSLAPKTEPQVPSEAVDSKEADKLKAQVKDLTEKLETLKLKRAEDRDKLREYEKSKLQIQQVSSTLTAQPFSSDH